MTEDGRPFVRRSPREPDDDLALWTPTPEREGDPVYCCGVRVGHIHGPGFAEGPGCVVSDVPLSDLPPKVAAHFEEQARLGAEAQRRAAPEPPA